MAIEQFYRLRCDSHSCEEGPDSKTDIAGRNRVAALRRLGWSKDGYGRVFCPDCTKRSAHSAEPKP